MLLLIPANHCSHQYYELQPAAWLWVLLCVQRSNPVYSHSAIVPVLHSQSRIAVSEYSLTFIRREHNSSVFLQWIITNIDHAALRMPCSTGSCSAARASRIIFTGMHRTISIRSALDQSFSSQPSLALWFQDRPSWGASNAKSHMKIRKRRFSSLVSSRFLGENLQHQSPRYISQMLVSVGGFYRLHVLHIEAILVIIKGDSWV